LSTETYVVLKPDTFHRAVQTEVVTELRQWAETIQLKIFCPTANELLSVFPSFCWQYDYFEDWVSIFKNDLSCIIKLKYPIFDLDVMNTLKGSTFEPDAGSLRGRSFVSTRVDNILHIPSSNAECEALAQIWDERALLSEEVVEELWLEMHRPYSCLTQQDWYSLLQRRLTLKTHSTTLMRLVELLPSIDLGSLIAQKLAQNFHYLAAHENMLLTTLERRIFKQKLMYPEKL